MQPFGENAFPGDPGHGGDLSVETWVARWLERLNNGDASPEEEGRKILAEAPAQLKPLLQRELRAMSEFAAATLSGVDVTAGAVAGGYQLLRVLGQGSSGVVWSARSQTGETRAIKFVHALYLASEEGLKRFHNEVQAAQRVSHPAVNRLRETVEFGGSIGLVSDLVGDGATLANEVVKHTELGVPPDARQVLERLLPVLGGVAALHGAGVLHLDLKPGNLLVAKDGSLLVSDFGLARLMDLPSATHTFQLLGTPAYMSPEVARGDRRHADERSDIFSLGVTLYEALCLARPFGGGASHGVLHSVQHQEPPPLPGRLRGLTRTETRRLRAVLARCLEKDPDRRYARVEQVADDIQGLLAGQAVHGRSLLRTLRASLRRRQRPVLALIAILFLLGTAWHDHSMRKDLTRVLSITNRIDEAWRPGGTLPSRAELELLLVDLHELLGSVPREMRRTTLQRVGVLLARRGIHTELAVGLFTDALELATEDTQRTALLSELGLVYGRRSELDLAIHYLVRAADSLVGQDSSSARLQRALALAQASSYATRFNLTVAGTQIPTVDEVLALARKTLESTPPEHDRAMRTRLELKSFELAGWSSGDGPTEDDLARMLQLLDELDRLPDTGQPWEIEALCYVGNVMTDIKRPQEAEPYLRRAVERAAGSLGEKHLLTLVARLRLARARMDQGHIEESYGVYSSVIPELELQLGPLNRTVLDYSVGLFVLKEGMAYHEDTLPFVKDLMQRASSVLDPSDTVMTLIQRAWIQVCLGHAMADEARKTLAEQWLSGLVNFRAHRKAAEKNLQFAVMLEWALPGDSADVENVLRRIKYLEADLLEDPPDEYIGWDWRKILGGYREQAELLLAGYEPSLDRFEALLASIRYLMPFEAGQIEILTLVRHQRRAGNPELAAQLLQQRWPERGQRGPFLARGNWYDSALQVESLEVEAALGNYDRLRLLPNPARLGLTLNGPQFITARAMQLLEQAGR